MKYNRELFLLVLAFSCKLCASSYEKINNLNEYFKNDTNFHQLASNNLLGMKELVKSNSREENNLINELDFAVMRMEENNGDKPWDICGVFEIIGKNEVGLDYTAARLNSERLIKFLGNLLHVAEVHNSGKRGALPLFPNSF